jgi:hypothetical protein
MHTRQDNYLKQFQLFLQKGLTNQKERVTIVSY